MDEESFEKRNRIQDDVAFQMLMVAGFYDMLLWGNAFLYILIVGFLFAPIIWLFAWLTFYIWFKMHGIGIFDVLGKYGLRKLFAIVLKGVPGLPSWTFGTFLTISAIKAEDAIHNKLGVDVKINANNLKDLGRSLSSGVVGNTDELRQLRREGLTLARKYQEHKSDTRREKLNNGKEVDPYKNTRLGRVGYTRG